MRIIIFRDNMAASVLAYFKSVFRENNRSLELDGRDSDIQSIKENYLDDGCFWLAIDAKQNIIGSIALRRIDGYYEIRRFFVRKKFQRKKIGSKLLDTVIDYAIIHDISVLKAATLENGEAVHHLFYKYGFCNTARYNNSSADIFFKLNITVEYAYNYQLKKLKDKHENSIILNPTENIPLKSSHSSFLEGLYVSERFKDVNDKVIFAGRNEYILFFEFIKKTWCQKLGAFDVDLKTLSGLNAHLVLFLCIIKPGDVVLLLPENCGGHFATQKILESIGARVLTMIPDLKNHCVNIDATKKILAEYKPNFIFVDRSEGLIYENFDWLDQYNDGYKIFDASQYFSQILTKQYPSPFDMGFDMIVSTLHKNYPGPQKGIIAVKGKKGEIWELYLQNAKTYISNTHPLSIANSLYPLLDNAGFLRYSNCCQNCSVILEKKLLEYGVPVVRRDSEGIPTLHIWILCNSKEASYDYYQKLEYLGILTNYRLLPYDLGYGLRIGVNAAVRMGMCEEDVPALAAVMAEAYHNPLSNQIEKKAKKVILKIIAK